MLNHYGPTETTVGVTTYAVVERGASAHQTETLPLGRPLDNTRIYILDGELNPVPVGVAGELYVGGDGLARGYLNRPALTAERFIPDPFSVEPCGRLYRTGDLVRYLPDGNIEFLGRADHQVKVRGFRIELGELEATLSQHPGVREAAVLVTEDATGDRRLVAYVAGVAGGEELRAFMRGRLPDYMVPSHFVALDSLPLTPNGKLDRQALASLKPPQEYAEAYAAPSSEVEEILTSMWAEVLGLGQVGVRSDFFALGGHSLLATQLISRVRQTFRVEIALRVLFENPTVEAFAARIGEALRAGSPHEVPPIEPARREEQMPLSYAQQRLWFLSRLEAGSSNYNVTSSIRLIGNLNAAALERSFTEITRIEEVTL